MRQILCDSTLTNQFYFMNHPSTKCESQKSDINHSLLKPNRGENVLNVKCCPNNDFLKNLNARSWNYLTFCSQPGNYQGNRIKVNNFFKPFKICTDARFAKEYVCSGDKILNSGYLDNICFLIPKSLKNQAKRKFIYDLPNQTNKVTLSKPFKPNLCKKDFIPLPTVKCNCFFPEHNVPVFLSNPKLASCRAMSLLKSFPLESHMKSVKANAVFNVNLESENKCQINLRISAKPGINVKIQNKLKQNDLATHEKEESKESVSKNLRTQKQKANQADQGKSGIEKKLKTVSDVNKSKQTLDLLSKKNIDETNALQSGIKSNMSIKKPDERIPSGTALKRTHREISLSTTNTKSQQTVITLSSFKTKTASDPQSTADKNVTLNVNIFSDKGSVNGRNELPLSNIGHGVNFLKRGSTNKSPREKLNAKLASRENAITSAKSGSTQSLKGPINATSSMDQNVKININLVSKDESYSTTSMVNTALNTITSMEPTANNLGNTLISSFENTPNLNVLNNVTSIQTKNLQSKMYDTSKIKAQLNLTESDTIGSNKSLKNITNRNVADDLTLNINLISRDGNPNLSATSFTKNGVLHSRQSSMSSITHLKALDGETHDQLSVNIPSSQNLVSKFSGNPLMNIGVSLQTVSEVNINMPIEDSSSAQKNVFINLNLSKQDSHSAKMINSSDIGKTHSDKSSILNTGIKRYVDEVKETGNEIANLENSLKMDGMNLKLLSNETDGKNSTHLKANLTDKKNLGDLNTKHLSLIPKVSPNGTSAERNKGTLNVFDSKTDGKNTKPSTSSLDSLLNDSKKIKSTSGSKGFDGNDVDQSGLTDKNHLQKDSRDTSSALPLPKTLLTTKTPFFTAHSTFTNNTEFLVLDEDIDEEDKDNFKSGSNQKSLAKENVHVDNMDRNIIPNINEVQKSTSMNENIGKYKNMVSSKNNGLSTKASSDKINSMENQGKKENMTKSSKKEQKESLNTESSVEDLSKNKLENSKSRDNASTNLIDENGELRVKDNMDKNISTLMNDKRNLGLSNLALGGKISKEDKVKLSSNDENQINPKEKDYSGIKSKNEKIRRIKDLTGNDISSKSSKDNNLLQKDSRDTSSALPLPKTRLSTKTPFFTAHSTFTNKTESLVLDEDIDEEGKNNLKSGFNQKILAKENVHVDNMDRNNIPNINEKLLSNDENQINPKDNKYSGTKSKNEEPFTNSTSNKNIVRSNSMEKNIENLNLKSLTNSLKITTKNSDGISISDNETTRNLIENTRKEKKASPGFLENQIENLETKNTEPIQLVDEKENVKSEDILNEKIPSQLDYHQIELKESDPKNFNSKTQFDNTNERKVMTKKSDGGSSAVTDAANFKLNALFKTSKSVSDTNLKVIEMKTERNSIKDNNDSLLNINTLFEDKPSISLSVPVNKISDIGATVPFNETDTIGNALANQLNMHVKHINRSHSSEDLSNKAKTNLTIKSSRNTFSEEDVINLNLLKNISETQHTSVNPAVSRIRSDLQNMVTGTDMNLILKDHEGNEIPTEQNITMNLHVRSKDDGSHSLDRETPIASRMSAKTAYFTANSSVLTHSLENLSSSRLSMPDEDEILNNDVLSNNIIHDSVLIPLSAISNSALKIDLDDSPEITKTSNLNLLQDNIDSKPAVLNTFNSMQSSKSVGKVRLSLHENVETNPILMNKETLETKVSKGQINLTLQASKKSSIFSNNDLQPIPLMGNSLLKRSSDLTTDYKTPVCQGVWVTSETTGELVCSTDIEPRETQGTFAGVLSKIFSPEDPDKDKSDSDSQQTNKHNFYSTNGENERNSMVFIQSSVLKYSLVFQKRIRPLSRFINKFILKNATLLIYSQVYLLVFCDIKWMFHPNRISCLTNKSIETMNYFKEQVYDSLMEKEVTSRLIDITLDHLLLMEI